MINAGSFGFFKSGENQLVDCLEQELVNVFLLKGGISSEDEILFVHDMKNLTTVIFIKEPERIDRMLRKDLGEEFAEIATRFQRDSITLANIPLEVIIEARKSPLLI